MTLFTQKDFRVFDIPGFGERMEAIRTRIRPRLTEIGEALAPGVSSLVDRPLYVHVARHARRTVNPPDDTWAALGGDKRGYKKDVHFKIAISRRCIRVLFEAGPEYYAKAEWAQCWRREVADIADSLGSARGIAWFRDEHDEEPEAELEGWSRKQFAALGREIARRRDGHLVIGRRIDASKVVAMTPAGFKRVVVATFGSVAPLFHLHEPRSLSPR